MKTLRLLALPLAAFALALGAAACGDDDDNGLRRVTLMLDFVPNTNHNGIYLALANGWYEEEGIDLRIVEPAAAGVEQLVGSREAEFGISYQEYVIPARAAGVPVVSIAAILQHNDSSFMSLAGLGIQRPADMAGKRYGGFGGPLEIALIRELVACDGGNPDSVQYLEVGAIDPLVGMEQGQFDFVWVFEAWDVIRAREILGIEVNTVRFQDYFDCIPDWYTPVIITSESMIANDPDVVGRFMRATARGYEASIESPEDAGEALLAAVPELDRALVIPSSIHLAGVYVDAGRQWGLQDEAIWVEFEAFLREAGLTDAEVDVTEAYTNDFIGND